MKLNNKNTIYVGFAFLLICMFWQVYDNVIAKILIDSFGLGQTSSGFVMALDNILAIILLPIFGAISDKTKSKYGKRKPYIFIGTILAAILITGISLFDNAQLNKIKEAEIGPVLTVEIKESQTLQVYSSLDTLQEIDFVPGDKVYSFTFEDQSFFYTTKELAVMARAPYVESIRENNVFYYIGFLVMLCFVLIAMAMFRTPAVSLMPDVTPKPLRSKANAIINLMGSAGGIIALIFMSFLAKNYHSYSLVFLTLAVLMVVCLIIFTVRVNEPLLVKSMLEQEKEYGIIEDENETNTLTIENSKEVKKSFILILLSIIFWFMAYNAATSKFSVYASNVLDTGYTLPLLIAQAAAIVSYIPIGMIASKVGRKKTILVGIAILFVAFLLATFLNENSAFLIMVAMALAGIGWATINVNSYPMVVEMSKGSNIGKYTGIYYTASMAAQIITPVLSGIVMDLSNTMLVLFPYCVIFCLLAFSTMSFVKHGDSKPIPSKKIDAYQSMDD